MPEIQRKDLYELVEDIYDIMKSASDKGMLHIHQADIEVAVREKFAELLHVMPFFEPLIVTAAQATFYEVARDPSIDKVHAVDNVCTEILQDKNYVLTGHAPTDDEHKTSSSTKRMRKG